jgi:8-oxo-dGTP pyrophosphatase MutT (NUDIX family)
MSNISHSTQNPWKTLTNTEVYDNKWIQISHREVINPSGNPGIYGVVHFKNLAVGIVPIDTDWNTWLVGQYRYTLDLYTWEIPEGGCPVGELPLDAAKRELLEETGILAEHWTPVLDMHTSNSVTDEVAIAYLAQGLTFGEAEPEDTEALQVRKLPFDEVIDMVLNGEITDGLSVAALLQVEMLRKRGRFL